MTCGIYKITKKDTRQIYIGQSIDIERRIEEHKASRYDNTYIDNAINKHGVDAFDYEIIEELEPIQEVLDERERYWIKEYKSFLEPNHYNLESGGVRGVKIDLNMDEIKKQYLSGIPIIEIAKENNCGKSCIEKRLKVMGVVLQHKDHHPEINSYNLKKDYESGLSSTEIADKYGLAHSSVLRRLKSVGVAVKDKNIRDDLDVWELKEKYESGKSTPQLAKEYGCDIGTITKRLKSASVVWRDRSGKNSPKYKTHARVVKYNKARGQTYGIKYDGKIIKQSVNKEYLEKISALINNCFEVKEAISSVELPKYKKPNIVPKKGIKHPNYRKDIPSSEELLEEYENGMTIPKLAEKYNCGTTTIHKRISQVK